MGSHASEKLSPEDTTKYRALAARANFLVIDRGDLVFIAKELTRQMAAPSFADWDKLVRLGRYLKGHPRMVTWYRFQDPQKVIETHSDTDWAGRRRTRRSTTGGFASLGTHLIKMWCRTQAIIALSSVEAELYGLVRASAETLGSLSLAKDLGLEASGRVLGDASAALAIVARQGLGKLRHVDTHDLWVQEKRRRGSSTTGRLRARRTGRSCSRRP